MKTLFIWFAVQLLAGPSLGVSMRKIYTLFTDRKSWNEATAICESQFGQLVKINTQLQTEEINYLDIFEWNNRVNNVKTFINISKAYSLSIFATSGLWLALHMPFMNNNLTNQDCEPVSYDVNVSVSRAAEKCSKVGNGYTLRSEVCDEERMFICQRFEGDCWYEPFFEERPKVFLAASPSIVDLNTEAKPCAKECKNFYDVTAGDECWGFTFYPNTMCMLHVDNSPLATSNYLQSTNKSPGQDHSTFYVCRCFEGTIDIKAYDSFLNKNSEPETACTITQYRANYTVLDMCYCSTQEYPPISEPLTSKEKAQCVAQELTINFANTSAAKRKLTSADDDRPGGIGVA